MLCSISELGTGDTRIGGVAHVGTLIGGVVQRACCVDHGRIVGTHTANATSTCVGVWLGIPVATVRRRPNRKHVMQRYFFEKLCNEFFVGTVQPSQRFR